MTGGLTLSALALLGFCVLAEIGRELNFKAASTHAAPDRYAISLMTQPLMWCGIGLWVAEVGVWLLVLEHTPLAVAFPITTLTYAGTPLAAALVLKEPLSRRQKLGAGLVSLGVLCIALSGFGRSVL
ncbi:MAG: permease [Phenylobacterium sp.]|nr:permease [Phenylobacterium sp.]